MPLNHRCLKDQYFITACVALWLALPLHAHATTPNPPIFGVDFGVNIKTERITEKELDAIAALGIRRVRIGIPWYHVEHKKGDYNWDYPVPRDPAGDDYDDIRVNSYNIIIDQIISRGLKIDATLNESNGAYTGPEVDVVDSGNPPAHRLRAPHSSEEMAAFAAFAAATVKHYHAKYGPDAIMWHIYNEPDRNGSFAPKADGAVFGVLMQKVCEAIRAVEPKSRIMGPALSAWGDGDFPYDFIDAIFTNANPLTCIDGFTVHPYRARKPETAAADYVQLADHLKRWQPPGKTVPVAVDEWGVSTARQPEGKEVPPLERWRDFSDREQAALMLRFYLTNLEARLPLTVLYDWRDRGTDPTEREDHFGVVGFKYEEKPALVMFRNVWPTLLDRPLLQGGTAERCGSHTHVLRFGANQPNPDDATDGWIVAWSEGPEQSLDVTGQVGIIKDIFGAAVLNDSTNSNLRRLTLTDSPLLIQYRMATPPILSCPGALPHAQ